MPGAPAVPTHERWEALVPRLRTHLSNQPDMKTKDGPRRWAQMLFQWSCEAMYLAYGVEQVRSQIKEATKDFFDAKSGGLK